ncbi:MAG: hypothetical protein ACFFCY_11500 [Promethearchaeota archaeon]
MEGYKQKLVCLLLIFLLFFFPFIPIFLRALLSVNVATIDVEYDNTCLLGNDQPVEGAQIEIRLDGNSQGFFYTDSLGQYNLLMTKSGNYSFRYFEKGVPSTLIDITEGTTATYNVELDCNSIDPIMKWSHDLTEIADTLFTLQYYDGSSWVNLTAFWSDPFGKVFVGGLFYGEFRFTSDWGITNDTFTVAYNTGDSHVSEMFIVAKGIIISIIILIGMRKLRIIRLRSYRDKQLLFKIKHKRLISEKTED